MSSFVFLFFIASGNKKKCSCQNPVPIFCGHSSSQFLLFDHLCSSVWVFINLTKTFAFFLVLLYLRIKNCDIFLRKGF